MTTRTSSETTTTDRYHLIRLSTAGTGPDDEVGADDIDIRSVPGVLSQRGADP